MKRSPKFVDMTGLRFGKLLVVSPIPRTSPGRISWLCKCDCGNEKVIDGGSLRKGLTKSCGCFRVECKTTHGMNESRIYKIWENMVQRCTNEKTPGYSRYGGRGIKVCESWKSFSNFMRDMGEPGDSLQIDRIDNDKGYFPGNCRWVTCKVNCRNKSDNRTVTAFGETLCISEWSERSGIAIKTIEDRVNRGWSPEDCVTAKPYSKYKQNRKNRSK